MEKILSLASSLMFLSTLAVCVPATPSSPTTVLPAPTSPAAIPTSPPTTTIPLIETPSIRADSMKIRLNMEDTVITATLIDSKTTQDFISLLPLILALEDYLQRMRLRGVILPLETSPIMLRGEI